MTDRSRSPLRQGYLYVATSDRLQEWALQNDRAYLFKIGFAAYGTKRLDYLNGRIWNRPDPPRPCLNFSDWRFVACWDFATRRSAEKMEASIHKLFKGVFDRLNHIELIANQRPGNGETEIFRLRRKDLPDAASKFAATGMDSALARQAIDILEKSAVDIVEGIIRRSGSSFDRLADHWDDDHFEEPENDGYDVAEQERDDLIAQFSEDRDRWARANEDGWPYEDGNGRDGEA